MRRTTFIVAFVAMLLAAGTAAGQDVSVQAFVNETVVGDEERVVYTLEVDGAGLSDVDAPRPPETEGLALMQPVPSTQHNLSFVNGVQKQSVAFQWSYRPLRTGKTLLKPSAITVRGRFYRTSAIEVEVVPQSQRPQRRTPPPQRNRPFAPPSAANEPTNDEERRVGDDDMFIKVMPSTRQAFQNEQITVEYQLYFRPYIQPRESRLADSWDAEGFWREELPVEGRPIPRAVVENGLRYNTITLKRVAVFPTRHGTLRIDPLRIETEIFAASTSRDPFGRFFSTAHPFETVPLASPPLVIEVKPLPAGAPSSFSGAVGQYDITTHIDRDSVQVGEGVRVRMRVAGTGNLAMLEAPTFETPGVFERYGPQIEMALDSTSQRVRGAKTFTYTLVPRSNGTFTLPALEYSFFDPRALKYQTMRAGAAQIRVTGTAAAVATGATAAGLPVDDIAGPALTAHWEPLHRTPLHRSPWTYLALALPLLLLGGVAIHHRHATRLATDIAFARRRRAHPLAQRHLKQAAALRREGAPAAFFEELERAVLGFTGNRLNIPERGLTRLQLDAHLAAAGIDGTLRMALQDFLTRCDQGRFAPITPDRSALDHAYEQAHELIAALDDAFERQLSPAHHAR